MEKEKTCLGCSVSYVSALLTSIVISIRCFQTRASRSNMKTRQDTQSETLRYCATRHWGWTYACFLYLLLFDLFHRCRVVRLQTQINLKKIVVGWVKFINFTQQNLTSVHNTHYSNFGVKNVQKTRKMTSFCAFFAYFLRVFLRFCYLFFTFFDQNAPIFRLHRTHKKAKYTQ